MDDAIYLVPYDSNWPRQFDALANLYRTWLSGLPVTVEHVGSTSVPGLASKPILDIDIIVPGMEAANQVSHKLETLGYMALGEQGVPGRFAFELGNALNSNESITAIRHNLYVCLEDSESLANHLAFRDYLRTNRWAVKHYQRIKYLSARMADGDTQRYVTLKTGFVSFVLARCGFSDMALSNITSVNRSFSGSRPLHPFI